MDHYQRTLQPKSRREFLKSTAIAGAGLGLGSAGLMRRARAAQTTIRFSGWAFEPQVVERT